MPKVTIITVGAKQTPILPKLLSKEEMEYSVVCHNLLDFELPPKVENAIPQWHRHELRNVLKQIAAENFQISSSLKNLLQENDRLDLNEIDLALTSHISQIEQNSQDLLVAYDLLVEQANKENLDIIPLVKDVEQLLFYRNKKYAPVRYYYLTNELLDEDLPDRLKENLSGTKEAKISDTSYLKNVELSSPALESLMEGDLNVILPTDIVSLGVLVSAKGLLNQIQNIPTPLILVWPFDQNLELEDSVKVIGDLLGFGTNIDTFAEDLALLTDYIIINKQLKDKIGELRSAGCRVLLSQFYQDDGQVNDNLIETMFNVADLKNQLSKEMESKEAIKDEIDKETKEESDIISEEEKQKSADKSKSELKGKGISQLEESPEEAGIENIKEDLSLGNNQTEEQSDDDNLSSIIEDINEAEEMMETRDIETEQTHVSQVNSSFTESKEEEVSSDNDDADQVLADDEHDKKEFSIREEEDWIDAVKRAIEQCFEEEDDKAVEWLIAQSSSDADSEVQIADQVVTAWIDLRTMPDRKRGAEIVSKLSKKHQETYQQILQRHMVETVKEKQEDKRRILIPLFSLLHEVDVDFSEMLIRGITKELASLSEDNAEISVVELSKLTILQLVVLSRRLMRVAIQELLVILDEEPNIGPEIWNILTTFDAGSVAIELVTNFSTNKVEEIIRRGNLLRFTGSYYTTISRVLQAWKEGDKAAISAATGSILPEETLRKFERLELARKLDKLKMVQLSTLAESLGKDTETVERLITELIVNDELSAEMKLIDDKMYLVSEEEDDEE